MKNVFLTLVIFCTTSAFAKTDRKDQILKVLEHADQEEVSCLESFDGQSTVGAEDCASEKKFLLDKAIYDLKKYYLFDLATNDTVLKTNEIFKLKLEAFQLKRDIEIEKIKEEHRGGTLSGKKELDRYNEITSGFIKESLQ